MTDSYFPVCRLDRSLTFRPAKNGGWTVWQDDDDGIPELLGAFSTFDELKRLFGGLSGHVD